MDLTRRTLATTALAAAAAGPAAGQIRSRPIVIAHRGASGERPEHTLMAYKLAIAEGADFIEPDLVMTRDGVLVVRHENDISGTTDVARRPEFADRKVLKVIDGRAVTGWFTEDFTLAELKTLRARERLPKIRPGSARFDGKEPIPTYQEVIDLAKAESRRLGRTIGTYPEMKHPGYFAAIGLPIEPALAAMLKKNGLDSRTAPVFVQCFEVAPLKAFKTLSQARRVQLASVAGGPADRKGVAYAQMLSPAGLKEIATYADGLGPEWPLVVPISGDGLGGDTPLVTNAHAAGLVVHPWTVRAENMFLPKALRKGTAPGGMGDPAALYKRLYFARIDGLFSDFPALAVANRP
jgi:glycerophosphoryl diester phosphodiesterase